MKKFDQRPKARKSCKTVESVFIVFFYITIYRHTQGFTGEPENIRRRCRSVRRSTPPPAVAAVSCWASCPRLLVLSCEAPAIAGASVWKCRRVRPALFLSVLSYRFSVWFRRSSFRLFASLFRRSNIDSSRIYIEFPPNLY